MSVVELNGVRETAALEIYQRGKRIIKIPLDSEPVSIGGAEDSDIIVPSLESENILFVVRAERNYAIFSAYRLEGEARRVEFEEKTFLPEESLEFGTIKVKVSTKKLFKSKGKKAEIKKGRTLKITPKSNSLLSISAELFYTAGGKKQSVEIGEDGLRIGKAPDNDVVIADEYVSGHHCVIALSSGGVKVFDLQSTNGTWLDSSRISEAYLAESQSLRLGDFEVQIKISSKKERLERRQIAEGFLAVSPNIQKAASLVVRLAPYDEAVLLTGETGTGKELFARALHFHSPRRSPFEFVAVNCAAIPSGLAESVLFGYEKGAFTGASAPSPGAFRTAHNGTLLLDEIGDLPHNLQAKLLRAIEQRSIIPVGGSKEIPVNVRLVAATHKDLEQMAEKGEFRRDLFFRLNVLSVNIPPLRERKSDIIPLAQSFIKEASPNRKLILSEEAKKKLLKYDYPGNVRELKHIVLRTVLLLQGSVITGAQLAIKKLGASTPKKKTDTKAIEKETLLNLLRSTGGDVREICRVLGVSRPTLFRLLKKRSLSLKPPYDVKEP